MVVPQERPRLGKAGGDEADDGAAAEEEPSAAAGDLADARGIPY